MGKIHIRGGSPLRMRFEDDDDKAFAVRLEPKGTNGEYWVINDDTNKKVQTFQEGNHNIFSETNPDKKSCEISFLEQERAFV